MQEPGTARNVAQVLGVSESTISRTKGEVGDVLTLVYQLGFKLVPQAMTCYPDEYMRALHTLAQLQVKDGPKLEWD